MKIIYELKELPETCYDCPLAYYETNDDGENLYCMPLSHESEENIDGYFNQRRDDCPLKYCDET
jgi:hypothetical protein